MQDIVDALRTLPQAVPPGPVGPEAAAADVARGHRALSRQRHHRIAFSGAAVAVVAAVGVAVALPAGVGSTTNPAAAGSPAATQVTKVQLEAYTGTQPVGFRVSTVPTGWQVISSDRSSFVVAPPGASASQPDPVGGGQGVSFVGRIAVMLQGQSTMPSHSPLTKVNVNGREGLLGFAEGGTGASRYRWLIFPDAEGHKVLVQIPASVGLANSQIVRFAQGITVTGAAVAGKG
ncbi:MAG: hypothetical protein ACRDOI_12170 [Trebonia sp.]